MIDDDFFEKIIESLHGLREIGDSFIYNCVLLA